MHTLPATGTALPAVDGQLVTGHGSFRGVVVRETAGSTAGIRIYDGTSASGVLLADVVLAANASDSVDLPTGRAYRVGLFLDVVSGTVAGTFFVG